MKFLKNILFILLFIFCGCSNLQPNLNWENSKKTMVNSKKLKIGDIIIKKRRVLPYGWFGHSAIVVSDNTIGEYPKLNVGYCETGILDWLYTDRKIIVLRYKYFDEKFKKEFLKNLKKYKGKTYKLVFDKYDENYFYCSKYIWNIYIETAKKLGYKLDFDKYKNQIYIYPYDFLFSKDFEIIELL